MSTPSPPPRPFLRTRVGVYVAALWDERILLSRLAPHTYHPGSWTLPGGGMDHGEQPLDTVVREVQEEAGLPVTELELFHARSVSLEREGPYLSVQLVYRGIIRGEPRVVEEGGSTDHVAWVPLVEVPDLLTVALVDDVIARLAR